MMETMGISKDGASLVRLTCRVVAQEFIIITFHFQKGWLSPYSYLFPVLFGKMEEILHNQEAGCL